MTEKDLYAYKFAKRDHDRNVEKLHEFESVIYSPTTQRINGMPVEHSYNPDRLADVAAEHARLIMAAEKTASGIVTALQTIDRVEAILTREERDVLNARYRLLLPWEEISTKIHITGRTVFRIRDKILQKIRDL